MGDMDDQSAFPDLAVKQPPSAKFLDEFEIEPQGVGVGGADDADILGPYAKPDVTRIVRLAWGLDVHGFGKDAPGHCRCSGPATGSSAVRP